MVFSLLYKPIFSSSASPIGQGMQKSSLMLPIYNHEGSRDSKIEIRCDSVQTELISPFRVLGQGET